MKKIFLLFISFAIAAGAYAQSSGSKSVVFGNNDVYMNLPINSNQLIQTDKNIVVTPIYKTFNSAGARTTTVSGSRWYSYFDIIDANLGWPFTTTATTRNISWAPLWWDSSVTYRYSNGTFANEWSGVCQTIDPIRYYEYLDSERTTYTGDTLAKPGDISIGNGNSYTIDSIRVEAVYVRERHNVWDTLVLSVAPQNSDYYYNVSDGDNNTWFYHNPNIPKPDSTRYFSPQPKYADSIHRAVFPDNTAAGAVQTLDTFYINADSSGFAPDTTTTPGSKLYTLSRYTFPVKHNTIPAGQHFTISLAFKSGDPAHNSTMVNDSITQFNRFCPIYGFEGTTPTWMSYWQAAAPTYHDFNGGSYLDGRGRPSQNTTTYPLVNHTGSPARWLSQFTIQNYNSTDGTGTPDQYLWMDAHVSCSNCKTVREAVAVKNVANSVKKLEVFPNPASDNITVSFALTQAANINVSLTNAIGQVVASQNLGNTATGKAVFNTLSLPSGIYFYTVSADNTRYTNRVAITH